LETTFPLFSARRTPRPRKRHLGTPTHRGAFGTGDDVDLRTTWRSWRDSMWERMVVISGLRGPISKRHPWEHVLFQNSKLIPFVTLALNDPDFDDAGGFSDDDYF
jgi:hypothetical protein